MSIKTKGTEIWFIFPDSHGFSLVKLGCPKGFQGLSGSKSQIDETCLDSDEMEFGPGMASPQPITVNLDFDDSKVSHRDLIYMDDNDLTVKWIVGLSNGKSVPTVDNTTGAVTSWPTDRTFIEFMGYIADVPLEININANVTSAVSVQRSGKKTYHYKVYS